MTNRMSATTDKPPRYRIEAMALTAADVVRSLGGLLFDRRCLGWDTLVLLDGCADSRPLKIPGAECADLEPTFDMTEHPRAAAIATSVQLYRSDTRVCARIDAAIDSGSTEVVLWGDTGSVDPWPQLIAVAHEISRTAATFKSHALAASGAELSAGITVEKFLVTRTTWQPLDAHEQSPSEDPNPAQSCGSKTRLTHCALRRQSQEGTA
jgi:hypothetical protein